MKNPFRLSSCVTCPNYQISLFGIDERAKNINNTIKPGYKTLGENKIPFNGDNPLEKLEIILAKIIIINSTIIASSGSSWKSDKC